MVALQGAPAHAQARLQLCTYKYLGHRNIQNTVRYTVLSPARFKDFWRRGCLEMVTDVVMSVIICSYSSH